MRLSDEERQRGQSEKEGQERAIEEEELERARDKGSVRAS